MLWTPVIPRLCIFGVYNIGGYGIGPLISFLLFDEKVVILPSHQNHLCHGQQLYCHMNLPTSLWFAAYDIDGCHFAVYTHFFFYSITFRCRGRSSASGKRKELVGYAAKHTIIADNYSRLVLFNAFLCKT